MKLTNPQLNSAIIMLLKRLKSSTGQYPPDLLAARRSEFMEKVKAIQQSAHGGDSTSQAAQTSQATQAAQTVAGSPLLMETVLQYVLAGMLAVMVVTATYVYQDQIRDILNISGTEEQVVNTALPDGVQEADLSLTATAQALTATVTPSGTPTPLYWTLTAEPAGGSGNTAISTPEPSKTNPGLHLGQTKTPNPTDDDADNDNTNDTDSKDKDKLPKP